MQQQQNVLDMWQHIHQVHVTLVFADQRGQTDWLTRVAGIRE